MRKPNSSLVRCPQCGAWAAAFNEPRSGCALDDMPEEVPGEMCRQMRIYLLEMALRRAIAPDAFDERLRIRPGQGVRVLEAERDALRSVAALLGPIDAAAMRVAQADALIKKAEVTP